MLSSDYFYFLSKMESRSLAEDEVERGVIGDLRIKDMK